MRRPEVIFDITRLATRFSRPTPNGIDRVDISYAEHFLSEARGGRGALLGPAGVRAIDNRAARNVVKAIVGHWREDRPAEEDEVYQRLLTRLEGNHPDPGGVGPTRRRSDALRSIGGILHGSRIIGKQGLFPGRSLVATAPPNAIYLNVSQFPLWQDRYFRWLDRRPDIKAVFFIHDLLPITYPEFFPPAEAQRHQGRMEVLVRRSHGIIVASDHTRQAVEKFLQPRDDAPDICVIPLPVAPEFAKPEVVNLLPIRQNYFVSVGTIEPRKNHLLLLNIWRELANRFGDRTPTLVLAGVRGWDNENVVDMLERCRAIGPHVVEISGLSTPALRKIMIGARAVLMPTLAEGFGLPAIEAHAAGAQLIVSDRLGFELRAGPSTMILDPLDGLGWRDAIIAAAFGQMQKGPDGAAPRDSATQGWEWHIGHVERFIQAL